MTALLAARLFAVINPALKSTDLITAQAMVLKGPECREFKGRLNNVGEPKLYAPIETCKAKGLIKV